MATSAQTKKRLALAIINHLNTSETDGSVTSEDVENLQIASNCIAEAFKVDPGDTAAVKDAVGGQSLLQIYSVYEKLKGKSTASTEGASSASEARPATPQTPGVSVPSPAPGPGGANKDEAEKLKGQGNAAMQKKDYKTAIDFYTQALELVPLNPIYLSNRAAAYSGAQRHEEAMQDAEMAVAADPKYTKAWSRLGLAKFALGDAKGSMEAYKAGIDAEGSGGSDAMKRGYETAKKKYEEEAGDVGSPDATRGMPPGGGGGMPDLSALAGMFGGGGAPGGGGGGMPDLGALLQNPMMRQMAENIMQNPDMMQNMMSNPRVQEMMGSLGGGGGAGAGGQGGRGGGGMPDLSSLMNDPSIAEMARNFMGPGAGRGRGGQ